MNTPALSWVDAAIAAEEENCRLRLLLAALVIEFARARDLRVYAAEAIERKAA